MKIYSFPSGPNTSGTERRPLLSVDREREDRALRDSYAGRIARGRAADLLGVCAEWRPDVLVCDEVDFGSMIAAERMGLPYASVLVMAAGSFVRKGLVGERLNELRAEHGLPLDPNQHQAMLEIPSDKEPGTIVQEMQAGYMMKDRLLRPAMVGVAKAG